MRIISMGHALFAAATIGLGIIGLIYGDFAVIWQPVPDGLPMRQMLAYISAIIELAVGIGLLFSRTAAVASRILLVFLLLWLLLLRTGKIFLAPEVEASWLAFGETAVIVAGGWILFTEFSGPWGGTGLKFATGEGGIRIARYLFVAAMPMIGLSHVVYADVTAGYIPAWIPAHLFLAYFTGACHIAAGIGVFFGILPRLAVMLEAVMLAMFTLFVWAPGIVAVPTDRLHWTAFTVSLLISSGAWVVADSYRGTPWVAFDTTPKKQIT